jgi:hypothetical protein
VGNPQFLRKAFHQGFSGPAPTPSSTAYRDAVLADSPILYWRLAEPSGTTAADATGNGHTGTYHPGGDTISLGQPSALTTDTADRSIAMSGVTFLDHYVISAASTAFDTTSMTIEMWIHPTSGQTNKHGLASVMSSGGSARWYWRLQPTTGNLEVFGSTFSTSVNIAFAVWTYLVVTFDVSDSKWRIYVNGTLIQTSAVATLGGATNQPFTIGHNNAGGAGAEVFIGGMDEVALYGTALSAGRIAAHYAAR